MNGVARSYDAGLSLAALARLGGAVGASARSVRHLGPRVARARRGRSEGPRTPLDGFVADLDPTAARRDLELPETRGVEREGLTRGKRLEFAKVARPALAVGAKRLQRQRHVDELARGVRGF